MSKFELSVVKEYVPEWTYVDGVREFFQNALDQEVADSTNKMFFKYDEDNEKLIIGSRFSKLEKSSLLLGSTSKRDDEATIGQFGEGYKIATLVLLREGKEVVIYNYGAKEVWKPRFVKSKRYSAEVLTFFVEKKSKWENKSDSNLTIEISGITKEEYENIVKHNLHLDKPVEVFETDKGDILLEEKYKGKVFVRGLYVCDYDKYEYGYDFKPQYIKIDRDRRLVDNFELRWLASSMWMDIKNDKMREIASELIMKNASDVEYCKSVNLTEYKKTSDDIYNKFKDEYGEDAIPVSTNEELQMFKSKNNNAVVVEESYKEAILSSDNFEEPEEFKVKSTSEKLEEWLEKHKQSLSKKAIYEMKKIIREEDDRVPF